MLNRNGTVSLPVNNSCEGDDPSSVSVVPSLLQVMSHSPSRNCRVSLNPYATSPRQVSISEISSTQQSTPLRKEQASLK